MQTITFAFAMRQIERHAARTSMYLFAARNFPEHPWLHLTTAMRHLGHARTWQAVAIGLASR